MDREGRRMKFMEGDFRLLCCAVLIAVIMALLSHTAIADDAEKRAEVAVRGAEVMPFSLARTQHQFLKTADGGVQRIVARDDMDLEQVWSIRRHLEELAQRFGLGDFSGPAFIHGADMPGLAQLRAAQPGQLQIGYTAEAAGASLSFRTKHPALVAAVHEWFDAQLHDHGADAMDMNCPMHSQHQPN